MLARGTDQAIALVFPKKTGVHSDFVSFPRFTQAIVEWERV
jgi:hypothetical protein